MLIKSKGQGCKMFKRDLKRVYRQLVVDPGDIHLLGYKWRGHLYYDRVLTMGLRSAAYICMRTNAIAFICQNMGVDILNYLDDLAGWDIPPSNDDAYAKLGFILQKCGAEESIEKACPPSTKMIFIGILFDSENMTISIDTQRLSEILQLVSNWLCSTDCTKREEFLSRSFRSAQSILNYLNGMKVLFLLLGLHVDMFSSYELKLTMKGLDRKLKHLPKQAFPITFEILGKFREHLNLNTPLDATYWCLFLFALLLISRKSNLVPLLTKKFDKNKQLCRGDVTVFPSLIIVAFKWTKTIQLGNRILRIPLLAYPLSKFCPVNVYKRICSLNPCTSDGAAFSCTKKGKCMPITYNQCQNKLRELLCIIGLNPKLFSSHSFRRGGATLASKAGVSPSSIQLMGD
ncbi:unnamed protein product [Mytilus coruscus]|uniref:Tyr recombinase domain-containing protein n=1 Tax=Mytilus coruscus TaxID=42192 RepID=A0A6J8DPH4_MYTCO|nr:unnamed protein product [Mytilus coruscus]